MICLAACFAVLCLVQGLNAEPLVKKEVQKRDVLGLVCDLLKLRQLDLYLDLYLSLPLPVCLNLLVDLDVLISGLEAILRAASAVLPIKADVVAILVCGKDNYDIPYLSLLVKAVLELDNVDCGLLRGLLPAVLSLLGTILSVPGFLLLLLG